MTSSSSSSSSSSNTISDANFITSTAASVAAAAVDGHNCSMQPFSGFINWWLFSMKLIAKASLQQPPAAAAAESEWKNNW